jgi:hypothetical protein
VVDTPFCSSRYTGLPFLRLFRASSPIPDNRIKKLAYLCYVLWKRCACVCYDHVGTACHNCIPCRHPVFAFKSPFTALFCSSRFPGLYSTSSTYDPMPLPSINFYIRFLLQPYLTPVFALLLVSTHNSTPTSRLCIPSSNPKPSHPFP